MNVYFHTSCLGNLFKIAIRVSEKPTWGCLASEAIRLSLLRLENKPHRCLADLMSSFKLLRVSSCLLGILNFGDEITSEMVSCIGTTIISVVVEGPFSSLDDKLLSCISSFYSNKAKDISILSLLNRRLRLIFQDDAIWKDIVIKYKWIGGGVDGTEEEEWNAYRIESGLPYFNTERIRAIANTTSRLRLFYGTIIDTYHQQKIGAAIHGRTFESLFQRNLPYSKIQKRDLVLMIGRTGQHCSRDVHNSMHFMVPESATDHHLLPECKPIMKGARIIRTEASPKESRNYKSYQDPGTLVEQAPIKYFHDKGVNYDVEDYVFRIRRIGDERLSFIQFNHDPSVTDNEDDQQVHSLLSNILDRAASFVITVEYDPANEEQCFENLSSLYGEFISSRRRMLRELKKKNPLDNCKVGKTALVTQPAPLLVMLSIDPAAQASSPLKSSRPLSVQSMDDRVRGQEELQAIEISNAVARTHELLRDMIRSDSASNCSMPWYVQPYDRNSALEGPFKNGIYPGINWMIRAMQKQNCNCRMY